ncbi:MAG TPA: hypothetical protein PLP87_10370 [Clostridiales bacterium]|nr:hypothetical protein [Clostridiales bacterium]
MVTKKIVWDESMAKRCLDRVTRGYVPAYVHEERSLTRSFQAGEWDDFRRKISRETKK